MKIAVNEGARPVKVSTSNKMPAGMYQECHTLIDRLLAQGKIKHYNGPMDWCAPARFVRKSNGSPHFVENYQRLNVAGQRLAYPFTTAREVHSMLLRTGTR